MPSHAEIDHAASLLRAGRLVAFPTETVYGLGANALDELAVRRIFEVKGRPGTSPIIVHISNVEMVNSVVAEWPQTAQLLAQKFWPGPLTLVLKKQPAIPSIVTAGLDTVGVHGWRRVLKGVSFDLRIGEACLPCVERMEDSGERGSLST